MYIKVFLNKIDHDGEFYDEEILLTNTFLNIQKENDDLEIILEKPKYLKSKIKSKHRRVKWKDEVK